jgi:hypothetical protein
MSRQLWRRDNVPELNESAAAMHCHWLPRRRQTSSAWGGRQIASIDGLTKCDIWTNGGFFVMSNDLSLYPARRSGAGTLPALIERRACAREAHRVCSAWTPSGRGALRN